MKDTMSMVVPIIIGIGVSQINKIIDRSVASTVIVGGVSALSYASIINTAIQEILVTSIITMLFASIYDCGKSELESVEIIKSLITHLFLYTINIILQYFFE
jgi:putative peptidoglycan lipid II flippase